MRNELTLVELEARSGVSARTIRSWIQQGLLPRPLGSGPKSAYPAQSLTRLLAIKVMRDTYGMPLSAIRQELITVDWSKIEAYAAQFRNDTPPGGVQAASPSGALDYLLDLRAKGVFKGPQRAAAHAVLAPPAPAPSVSPLHQVSAALEALTGGRKISRHVRGQTQTHFQVTPDVEVVVKGPLSVDETALYERICDQIREILTGGSTDV